MDDDGKAMAMYAPTLVSFWYIGKLVRGFGDIATPDVYLPIAQEVYSLIAGALNTDTLDVRRVNL
jgi:hypothetical protein